MWRREPIATGLARVTQGYRAWTYGTQDKWFCEVTREDYSIPEGTDRYRDRLLLKQGADCYRVRLYLKQGNMKLKEVFLSEKLAKIAAQSWYLKHPEKFRDS